MPRETAYITTTDYLAGYRLNLNVDRITNITLCVTVYARQGVEEG